MKNRLLYIDRYNMTEGPFLQKVARMLARQQGSPPTLIVHGSGAYAEQALEGRGLFPKRKAGVLQVESQEQIDLVDRAIRQYNKKLVALLTEEGAPAIGVTGASRNLLRHSASSGIEAHRTEWLRELISSGTVPVVAALAYEPDENHIREVATSNMICTLADEFQAESVFFAKHDAQNGSSSNEDGKADRVADLLDQEALAEPDLVRRIQEENFSVAVMTSRELGEKQTPARTRYPGHIEVQSSK